MFFKTIIQAMETKNCSINRLPVLSIDPVLPVSGKAVATENTDDSNNNNDKRYGCKWLSTELILLSIAIFYTVATAQVGKLSFYHFHFALKGIGPYMCLKPG